MDCQPQTVQQLYSLLRYLPAALFMRSIALFYIRRLVVLRFGSHLDYDRGAASVRAISIHLSRSKVRLSVTKLDGRDVKTRRAFNRISMNGRLRFICFIALHGLLRSEV